MTACPFAHDDGAYVLGALSPSDRAAFEKHLAGCADCRDAVADIAVLPSLLGRLDAAGIERIAPPDPHPERMPALIEAARATKARDRLAKRRRYVGALLVAAILALVVGLGAGWLGLGRLAPIGGTTQQSAARPTPSQANVQMVAMTPIRQGIPVSAEVGLNGVRWGTRVTMHCTYGETDHDRAYTFRLVATGADGTTEQVGSWMAKPGEQVTVTGATRFSTGELVKIEVASYDGRPLLTYNVP
jgi:predicted anti-sigma-YlaC factor YlaD